MTGTQSRFGLGGPSVQSASNPSAVWIGKADNVVGDMASGRKPGRGIPNVKVAILDTGVSPHHPFTKKVQDPRDRRYKDRYKDFVPKTGEQPDDNNTSHGTRALDLVLRMYEDADVYVARVFETDLSKPERDAYRMGEAIRWAIWSRVDIITISAGFTESHRILREAITAANAAGILIFAAAANWGNVNGIAHPAAMSDDVFCIFASDGLNKATALRYNPKPKKDAPNFAFLGKLDESDPNGGTSIATALAAGFVARIIDFSRHLDSSRGVDVQLLCTRAGMRKVLKEISESNGRFYCITPWKLLENAQGYPPIPRIHRVLIRALERAD